MKTMKTCKYGCGKMKSGGKVTAVKKMQTGGEPFQAPPMSNKEHRKIRKEIDKESKAFAKRAVSQAKPKMAKGGYAPAQKGGDNVKDGIYGIPNAGRTDSLGFKKGGSVKKYAKGGSTAFGMLSVKAGIDKNPKPTAADRIAGAKKKGGSVKK